MNFKKLRIDFWRGLYRCFVDLELSLHKFTLKIRKRVDYIYLVKVDPNLGSERHPWRERR